MWSDGRLARPPACQQHRGRAGTPGSPPARGSIVVQLTLAKILTGASMRTLLQTLVLIISTSLLGAAQPASTPQPATKPKPPVRKPASSPAATAEPTAIIHTTAGDLHCTLFPKVAPIGVANFIGLANGSKDWTTPAGHVKKHGV